MPPKKCESHYYIITRWTVPPACALKRRIGIMLRIMQKRFENVREKNERVLDDIHLY